MDVASNIRGIGAKFRKAAALFKSSSDKLGRDIDSLRAELDTLKAERERVAALPITKQAAIGRVEELRAQLLTNPNASVDGLVAAMMVPRAPAYIDLFGRILDQYYNGRLEWALADIICDRLLAQIEREYAGGVTGIDDGARERELARLDAEILDCELAEESMIRAAASSGIAIPRRGDADPRAVLARDVDLPA